MDEKIMSRNVCDEITEFLVMTVLERAQEIEKTGKKVIHLEIGQPDFKTPECIIEAAVKAMQDGQTGYTHSLGIMPLREEICNYYAWHDNIKVEPEQVIITNGSSPAMLTLFSVLFSEGDEVIMPDPTYPCYANFVRFCSASICYVPSLESNNFQYLPEDVAGKINPRTKAILVNSPSNPAGTIISAPQLKKLCTLGPMVISDEIYHGLVYEGKAVSALEYTKDCCVLDGFSKRYAMTGWRLGWMVVPKFLVPSLQRLQQNFFISPNSISQWAGITALKYATPDVERMANEYNRRRKVIITGLRRLGFGVSSDPVGAFYVMANVKKFTNDSLSFAMDILEKVQVGVAPGIDFGPGGEGYLRFSYANSLENIEEAMDRLEKYLSIL